MDIDRSRRIASIRLHVERGISLVRNKYNILQSRLPLDYVIKRDKNDKIASVCAALCNLYPSVIPCK